MQRWAVGLGLVISLSTIACSAPEERDYEQGRTAANKGLYRSALSSYDHVIKRAPESEFALRAAKEGARLATLELKDFHRAARYHQFIVLHAKEAKERVSSQKQLAGIYFDQLQNYEKAILELNKLVSDSESDTEVAKYKLDIARSNYYLNNFFQAQSELDDVLKKNVDTQEKFTAMVLKANIYIAQKEFTRAIEILKKVIEIFPEKAAQENVYQSLSVCFEESGNYKEAIQSLEIAKDKNLMPEYIEQRIKRLKEREKNRPGARGLRK
ncbi:MAG: tetratricopeptide repeat protein [Bdellovibrionaceae bacterium]|nr:tetratricopeptide repeat protein [Pseudobdellovibrionaceae bacterium]